jgi:dolichyl-phosphate-mannose--protein O-mannosyl transferase
MLILKTYKRLFFLNIFNKSFLLFLIYVFVFNVQTKEGHKSKTLRKTQRKLIQNIKILLNRPCQCIIY